MRVAPPGGAAVYMEGGCAVLLMRLELCFITSLSTSSLGPQPGPQLVSILYLPWLIDTFTPKESELCSLYSLQFFHSNLLFLEDSLRFSYGPSYPFCGETCAQVSPPNAPQSVS